MKFGTLFCIGLVVLGILLARAMFIDDDPRRPVAGPPPRQSGPRPPSKPLFDKSEAMQAKRQQLIRAMMDEGIISKVTVPGTLPRAWVLPRFYSLDFEFKQNFADVIYGYYFSDKSGMVLFYDNFSGQKVGEFSHSRGLRMK